jgi:hypothetical protein
MDQKILRTLFKMLNWLEPAYPEATQVPFRECSRRFDSLSPRHYTRRRFPEEKPQWRLFAR